MITRHFAATTCSGACSNQKKRQAKILCSFALLDRGGYPTILPNGGLGPVSEEAARNQKDTKDERAHAPDLLGLTVDHREAQKQHGTYSEQESSGQSTRHAEGAAKVRLLDAKRD